MKKNDQIFFDLTLKDVQFALRKHKDKKISHFLILQKKKSHWVSYNELEHINLKNIRRMIVVFSTCNPIFVRPRFMDDEPVIIGRKRKF